MVSFGHDFAVAWEVVGWVERHVSLSLCLFVSLSLAVAISSVNVTLADAVVIGHLRANTVAYGQPMAWAEVRILSLAK